MLASCLLHQHSFLASVPCATLARGMWHLAARNSLSVLCSSTSCCSVMTSSVRTGPVKSIRSRPDSTDSRPSCLATPHPHTYQEVRPAVGLAWRRGVAPTPPLPAAQRHTAAVASPLLLLPHWWQLPHLACPPPYGTSYKTSRRRGSQPATPSFYTKRGAGATCTTASCGSVQQPPCPHSGPARETGSARLRTAAVSISARVSTTSSAAARDSGRQEAAEV